MRDYTDHDLGLKIDGTYGVPVEFLSCPGCGKKYAKTKTYCTICEECKSCCRCAKPNVIPVTDELLTKLAENV